MALVCIRTAQLLHMELLQLSCPPFHRVPPNFSDVILVVGGSGKICHVLAGLGLLSVDLEPGEKSAGVLAGASQLHSTTSPHEDDSGTRRSNKRSMPTCS